MTKVFTIPTAEPFFLPGGKIGCLLIHGFTGTPKEMRPLGDSLASSGYTVLAPRLFGHATNPADMRLARWQDWLASVEDGLNLLKGSTDKQFVMGLSMGGILALIAAARYPIAGVASFSAPINLPADPRTKLLPLVGWLNFHAGKGTPDWHNLEWAKVHIDYPYYPSRAVLELKKLMEVMKEELKNIEIPALIVQSKGDRSIPPESLEYICEKISSKDKTTLWLENSGHVVICEPERETVFTAVKSLIHRTTENS